MTSTSLDVIRHQADLAPDFSHWRRLPARQAEYAPFPSSLDARLTGALQARGISRLFSHQAEAVEHILAGEHTVVVTPTASGKTLCYNLPAINALLADPEARALYLFSTKALARTSSAPCRP